MFNVNNNALKLETLQFLVNQNPVLNLTLYINIYIVYRFSFFVFLLNAKHYTRQLAIEIYNAYYLIPVQFTVYFYRFGHLADYLLITLQPKVAY